MKLKDIVVSLSLAKELKKLGIKQDSLFYYIKIFNHEGKERWDISMKDGFLENTLEVSAFTSEEIGNLLPKGISSIRDNDLNGLWYGCWYSSDSRFNEGNYASRKESDCRSKMLVHLIENHQYKVPII